MTIAIKVINGALILFALYMGLKQGWSMISGKPEMIEMFSKWNIGKNGMTVLGVITIAGALLVLFPRTFLWGNFSTAASILFIIALHLETRDIRGVVIEIPFFIMSGVILYLRHPLSEN